MPAAPAVPIPWLAAQLDPQPPARLFAVLDAAANDVLVDRLYEDPLVEFDLLLPGALPADVFHVAPFVVDLTGCDELTNWLLSGWGQAWGIYVIAPMTLDALQRHLRQFVEASLPDSTLAYFRFYDPRVFRVAAEAFEPAQLGAFFAPPLQVCCESEDRHFLRFSAGSGRLLRTSIQP